VDRRRLESDGAAGFLERIRLRGHVGQPPIQGLELADAGAVDILRAVLQVAHEGEQVSSEERNRYYEEVKSFGPLYGIPDEVTPPDLRSFDAYVRGMVDGDELRATDESRR
jgi:hypothetical protein